MNPRKVAPADCLYGVFDLPPLLDTLIKKKPLKDGERGPLLNWGGKYGAAFGVTNKTSHSPPPWQIFSGTLCSPSVKKPLRAKALARRGFTHWRPFVVYRKTSRACFHFQCTDQKAVVKKVYPLKAEKLSKDATKKSFERSAVLSAGRLPPSTLEHHFKDKLVMNYRSSKKASPRRVGHRGEASPNRGPPTKASRTRLH